MMRSALVLRSALACAALVCVQSGCTSKRDAQPPAIAGAAVKDAAQRAAYDAARDIVLHSEKVVVSARVAAGATLASLLRAQQVASEDAATLVSKAASVFDLRKVRANQPYRLERGHDGVMQRFEYEIDGDRFLRVTRGPDNALEAVVLPIPKTRMLAHVQGAIGRGASSLVAAMEASGETIDLTLTVAE